MIRTYTSIDKIIFKLYFYNAYLYGYCRNGVFMGNRSTSKHFFPLCKYEKKFISLSHLMNKVRRNT